MPSTTNPDDWFLDSEEISHGNTATVLIDGLNYFKELQGTIEASSSFNNLLISGWRLFKETIIDPDNDLTFQQLLENNVDDYSAIKSMLWYVPGTIGDFGAAHGPENAEFTQHINDNGGEAILDNRLPKGSFASHHQKYMVVHGDSSYAAFIGGIDIAPDRLDVPEHDNSVPRIQEYFDAWHDIQIKIEGPVVSLAMKAFQERWNDTRKPHGLPAPGGDAPSNMIRDADIPNINTQIGTHAIQLLKTYACKSTDGDGDEAAYPFAPGGIYSYQQGLIKAIRNAEQYVYVEDQYFWPNEITDELAEAVSRGVAVILVLAKNYDLPGLEPYHNFLRNKAIESIRERQGRNELVFAYHLEQTDSDQIYVHSKTVIIDDRYFVVGSGNTNRRSMTTDTELGVAVVDEDAVQSSFRGNAADVSRLALEYRKQLWFEHLGGTRGLPDDPFDDEGYPAGFPRSGQVVGHLHNHDVPEPRFCHLAIIPYALFNAKTSC